MRRPRTLLLVVALTLVVAFALVVAPLVADAQPPIRIGASLALTGTYVEGGQDLHRGYQLIE